MIKILIKYFLSFSLFGLSFSQVDYNSEIQTIFNNNCGDCHLDNSSGGLNLISYNNLMSGTSNNGPVITPYNHASSELWVRVNSGQMPPGNNDLTSVQVGLIAQWIDEGAFSEPGDCTDPQAYNCADDVWIDGEDFPNYTVEVGPIIYVNGCNYELNDFLEIEFVEGCELGPCEGYYNPDPNAEGGYGTCDYYQAPHGNDVEFTVDENGINVDWTDWANNTAPENAEIIAYHVQRCTENCIFITESSGPPQNSPFSCWPDCPIQHTDTFVYDDNPWDPGTEIKYAINVQYSNAEQFGMAIGASYVTPGSCPDMGDLNGDGGWNVLDIVTLANCVLAGNCADLENGCAGDMNDDGGWNVLDIVTLANCVLAGDCG
jgi:hypothetical protein